MEDSIFTGGWLARAGEMLRWEAQGRLPLEEMRGLGCRALFPAKGGEKGGFVSLIACLSFFVLFQKLI